MRRHTVQLAIGTHTKVVRECDSATVCAGGCQFRVSAGSAHWCSLIGERMRTVVRPGFPGALPRTTPHPEHTLCGAALKHHGCGSKGTHSAAAGRHSGVLYCVFDVLAAQGPQRLGVVPGHDPSTTDHDRSTADHDRSTTDHDPRSMIREPIRGLPAQQAHGQALGQHTPDPVQAHGQHTPDARPSAWSAHAARTSASTRTFGVSRPSVSDRVDQGRSPFFECVIFEDGVCVTARTKHAPCGPPVRAVKPTQSRSGEAGL